MLVSSGERLLCSLGSLFEHIASPKREKHSSLCSVAWAVRGYDLSVSSCFVARETKETIRVATEGHVHPAVRRVWVGEVCVHPPPGHFFFPFSAKLRCGTCEFRTDALP